MDEQLLIDLKERLHITWKEEDESLKKIIMRSMAYLLDLTGASFDFSEEEWPKELLLERCRYVYNNAADEFEKNYHHELARLILKTATGKAGVANGTV